MTLPVNPTQTDISAVPPTEIPPTAIASPVLKTIETVRESGVWLELVHLCIPGANDSEPEVRDMCRWVKAHLGAEVPLHFTRFSPQYQMKNVPPTPFETLIRCREIALGEG